MGIQRRFVEEMVCELIFDGQAGFGQGMWEGRCPRQREPQKLHSPPRSGKTRGVTGASGDSGASTQDSGTAGEGPGDSVPGDLFGHDLMDQSH